MKQTQKILRFLFPSYQDTTKAVHPTMRPLYNPAASFESCLPFNCLCLFATRTDMSGIAKLFHQVSYLTRIIPLIQAHPLRLFLRRLRPFYRNTFYRRLCHFAIMSISSINRQANRHTRTFSKHTSFNAFFGPIRRVWTCFFPRQVGLWSWRHPSIAMTSQSLSSGHNLPRPSSTVAEKLRLLSTPESVSGLCCSNKFQSDSARSIDSRYAKQKVSHPLLCDPVLSAFRRRNDGYSDVLAAVVRSFPIIRLKSCICFLLLVFSSLNPFKGIIAFDYIGYSGVIRIGSKSHRSR